MPQTLPSCAGGKEEHCDTTNCITILKTGDNWRCDRQ